MKLINREAWEIWRHLSIINQLLNNLDTWTYSQNNSNPDCLNFPKFVVYLHISFVTYSFWKNVVLVINCTHTFFDYDDFLSIQVPFYLKVMFALQHDLLHDGNVLQSKFYFFLNTLALTWSLKFVFISLRKKSPGTYNAKKKKP